MHPYFHESFAEPLLESALTWLNEPARWSIRPGERCLRIEPDGGTDFWRKTHYGFEADNGHFLFMEVADDFVLSTRVHFHPAHQYDQAGLMVRVSPSCWLKTSVEHELEGPEQLGVVVTNHGYSDWSLQAYPGRSREVWLRVRREGSDYLVDASRDGETWALIRVAHLHEDAPGVEVSAGLYACSPKASGLSADFAFLTLAPRTLKSA